MRSAGDGEPATRDEAGAGGEAGCACWRWCWPRVVELELGRCRERRGRGRQPAWVGATTGDDYVCNAGPRTLAEARVDEDIDGWRGDAHEGCPAQLHDHSKLSRSSRRTDICRLSSSFSPPWVSRFCSTTCQCQRNAPSLVLCLSRPRNAGSYGNVEHGCNLFHAHNIWVLERVRTQATFLVQYSNLITYRRVSR